MLGRRIEQVFSVVYAAVAVAACCSGEVPPFPSDSGGGGSSGGASSCPAQVLPCHSPSDCDDCNPCTGDSCDGGVCTHLLYHDGDICGSGMVCSSGECVASAEPCKGSAWCNDGNHCTVDTCHFPPGDYAPSGCTNEPDTSGAVCALDDGTAGVCSPGTGECIRAQPTNAQGSVSAVYDCTYPTPVARCGARLEPMVRITFGGLAVVEPNVYWDKTLGRPCSFGLASDGTDRCFPPSVDPAGDLSQYQAGELVELSHFKAYQ